MSYQILLGEPEIFERWHSLLAAAEKNALNPTEREFFEKWVKALEFLEENPRHPGLRTHEIEDLSLKYGFKVWQSYLENRRSGARRMFWAYGPEKGQITILGIESHPDTSKTKAYKRVNFQVFPHQIAHSGLSTPKRTVLPSKFSRFHFYPPFAASRLRVRSSCNDILGRAIQPARLWGPKLWRKLNFQLAMKKHLYAAIVGFGTLLPLTAQADDSKPGKLEFEGPIQAMPASGMTGEWTVAGNKLTVTDKTRLDADDGKEFKVGQKVEVDAHLVGGKLVAEEIDTED